MKLWLWTLIGVFGVVLLVIGKSYFVAKGLSAENPQLRISGTEGNFALLMWSLGPIGFGMMGIAGANLGIVALNKLIDLLLRKRPR
jgi:hypothetical protein